MNPDNELYDAACELLLAAQRMRRATRDEAAAAAVPATAGCLAETLGALTVSCAALQASAGAPLGELVIALRRAEDAADGARDACAQPGSAPSLRIPRSTSSARRR